MYVIRTQERDKLQEYLTSSNIQTLIHYPIAPHKQDCYPRLNHLNLPISELLQSQVLSLPMSQVMTNDEVFKVIDTLNNF